MTHFEQWCETNSLVATAQELYDAARAPLVDAVIQLRKQRDALRTERDAYVIVLNDIASWREGDAVWSGFDEPGSAQAARDILTKFNAAMKETK